MLEGLASTENKFEQAFASINNDFTEAREGIGRSADAQAAQFGKLVDDVRKLKQDLRRFQDNLVEAREKFRAEFNAMLERKLWETWAMCFNMSPEMGLDDGAEFDQYSRGGVVFCDCDQR